MIYESKTQVRGVVLKAPPGPVWPSKRNGIHRYVHNGNNISEMLGERASTG